MLALSVCELLPPAFCDNLDDCYDSFIHDVCALLHKGAREDAHIVRQSIGKLSPGHQPCWLLRTSRWCKTHHCAKSPAEPLRPSRTLHRGLRNCLRCVQWRGEVTTSLCAKQRETVGAILDDSCRLSFFLTGLAQLRRVHGDVDAAGSEDSKLLIEDRELRS